MESHPLEVYRGNHRSPLRAECAAAATDDDALSYDKWEKVKKLSGK